MTAPRRRSEGTLNVFSAYDFKNIVHAFALRKSSGLFIPGRILYVVDDVACAELFEQGYVAAFSLIYYVAGPDGTKKLMLKPWGRITRRQEDNSRVRFLSQEEGTAISKQLRERYPNYLNVFILALHMEADKFAAEYSSINSPSGTVRLAGQTKNGL